MTNQTHPLWQHVRTVLNFPKDGINFFDITPLLRDHVNETIDALLAALPVGYLDEIDYFAGIEARGFVFASLLAGRTGKGMLLLRKQGKLPPPVSSKGYALEYGTDTLEMQTNVDSAKVLVVDDVLATGGTLTTATKLCQHVGHEVVGVLVLIDILNLHPPLDLPLYSVLEA